MSKHKHAVVYRTELLINVFKGLTWYVTLTEQRKLRGFEKELLCGMSDRRTQRVRK
jgi:hypothetical protein